MVDLDGTSEYSDLLFVASDCTETNTLDVYPNPIGENNVLTVNFNATAAVSTVQIFDMFGRQVMQVSFNSTQGEFTTVELQNTLSCGTYVLKVEGEQSVKRFVVQ